MKQNCHFDRGLAQYKHATLPLSFLGINTTLLGFPKRCITLVYLKGLKSYQPSKFKRVDFLPLYLVKRTFRLHFYWQLLSPLRYTKVIYLFGKPRSVVIMPEKLKGGVACLYCARPLSKWQFCFINRQRYDIHCLKLHCKYFGGTHYCGCLCYVSSSSLRVLRAANDSALPMAVPNPKYSHKK